MKKRIICTNWPLQKMLNFDEMRKHIRALLIFRSEQDKRIRREAKLPLHYLFTSGSLTRGEFKQMTGLGDKVAHFTFIKSRPSGI